MVPVNFDIPGAWAPLEEFLEWRQDASPHATGSFPAVVTRGNVESQSAGPSVAPVLGDIWSVHVSPTIALVTSIVAGDTLCRSSSVGGGVLTVVQITRDEGGWWLLCTADERAPI